MRRDRHHTSQNGGAAPAIPGFTAVAPEWIDCGAAEAAPAIPAAESTLGSHPCVALSSAQVLPEWINRNLAANAFASNGDNPLNFVSRFRGSLQIAPISPYPPPPSPNTAPLPNPSPAPKQSPQSPRSEGCRALACAELRKSLPSEEEQKLCKEN
jgi:hypothetical protein